MCDLCVCLVFSSPGVWIGGGGFCALFVLFAFFFFPSFFLFNEVTGNLKTFQMGIHSLVIC